jgi:hypothetical protein
MGWQCQRRRLLCKRNLLGKSGQTKGTWLKMCDAVGTAQYLPIVGGALQVSATACASAAGF